MEGFEILCLKRATTKHGGAACLGRLRQGNCEFEVNQSPIMRPCLKKGLQMLKAFFQGAFLSSEVLRDSALVFILFL
jgi:hypothetical protein